MNKAILIGRLTKDPEMRFTQTGISVCNFNLAVPRPYKPEETDFIQIVAWQKTAEFCDKYFTKGQRVAVEGRIEVSTWKDEAGQTRYKTQVVAEHVHFADSKRDRPDGARAYDGDKPDERKTDVKYPELPETNYGFDDHIDMEDDLPF